VTVHCGDVPGWIEAIGSSGAFFFAFAVFLGDRRRAERTEALKVHIWIRDGALCYVNRTGFPVTSVGVMAVRPRDNGQTPKFSFADELPPADTATVLPVDVGLITQGPEYIVFEYSFHDSQERVWFRSRDGVRKMNRKSAASWDMYCVVQAAVSAGELSPEEAEAARNYYANTAWRAITEWPSRRGRKSTHSWRRAARVSRCLKWSCSDAKPIAMLRRLAQYGRDRID
jgi:hypothetical protein